MSGPLAGVRVVEFAAIGPAPFAGMMLADHGADVVRIDRLENTGRPRPRAETHEVLDRGRRSVAVDLKHPRAVAVVGELLAGADVLIEGFRPGVMERLGLGPEVVLAGNPRLVYARMTGWGQDGPWAARAGHDIDYIAMTGALHPITGGDDGAPVAPLNMLGDFGGGGMLLAFGVLAGLHHAQATGRGQVIDAAILDGTALFTSMLHSMRANSQWAGPRGHNLFDGGAPYYGTFGTSDGGWMAVGAIEPQFYAELVSRLGLEHELPLDQQTDQRTWPAARAVIAGAFAARTRSEWEVIFAGSDACVAPVLDPDEATRHPHLQARGTFDLTRSVAHPAPAPRFGATPAPVPADAPVVGAHTRLILAEAGYGAGDIDGLFAAGCVAGA